MAEPRVVSWKVGRNFGRWHILSSGGPWCGQAIPDDAALCELASSPAAQLSDLCKKCLIAYAMSEAE